MKSRDKERIDWKKSHIFSFIHITLILSIFIKFSEESGHCHCKTNSMSRLDLGLNFVTF